MISAVGPISVPLYKLARLVAETETCQTWCGLTYPDASAASTLIDTPSTQHIFTPTCRRPPPELLDSMPLFVCGQGNAWQHASQTGGARNYLRPDGVAELLIADRDRYPDNDEESLRYFNNQVGELLTDLGELSGTSDRFDFYSVRQVVPPHWPDQEEEASLDQRYWLVLFEFTWK